MKITFTKMHGLGNDFILIDSRHLNLDTLSELSKKLCERRFGIGADQMLLLFESNHADFRMRIFNADGSEAEMCGNGIRCLAKYIWSKKLSNKRTLHIETLAGIIKPEMVGNMVRVDIGEPIFDPEKIPVNLNLELNVLSSGNSKLKTQNSKLIVDYPLKITDKIFSITCVSMGNPHAIIFVEDLFHFPVPSYGPMIENHPIFPKRTNVEFIEILNPAEIQIRVWERGAGETMACGTGASAAAVASTVKGLTEKSVKVHLLGGDLLIDWAENNHVYMTGPAVKVFEGTIEN